ncbi:NAD(P)H-hydrate dehydratase [Cesiribacter sp. SM1]|uniref:NAD(P)H-hydrate dehydratase n=1 Tax=Cesiribacter sp. SM1 TaxID=2861196 RepID=UPI001CD406EF|nr:NAD(P)H-hydrate dehydratase [Cesiribacter sp. SM1]
MSLKILTAEQIREADRVTIEEEKIESLELMERASAAFVRAFVKLYDEKRPVFVLCGTGNNGGDGMAITRLLISQQYKVSAFVVGDLEKASKDFSTNKERLEKFQTPQHVQEVGQLPEFPADSIIIDALLGSGLSRPITGLLAEVVNRLNTSGAEIVAVDVPSGIYLDKPIEAGSAVVCADMVITFEVPKLAFMLPGSGKHVRHWKLVNIGLSKSYLNEVKTTNCFTDTSTIADIYRRRDKWTHKGDYGKILLIAGSKGKMGAGVLCARACLRSGAGLLTVHVPASGYTIIQTSVPEAMALVDSSEEEFSAPPVLDGFNVIGVGPGLGTAEHTRQAFKKMLQQVDVPMVLDADALNLLARYPDLMEHLPKKAILTPHPKEFERLAGSWQHDYERLEKQKEFSRKHGVVLVLKGPHTSIAAPDGRVYFNSTGNPGLATGGTGDVLTGILAGMLGQGYEPFDAAVLGVFLHGLAADLAARDMGEEAIIASDLITFLPKAYQKINDPSFNISAQVF